MAMGLGDGETEERGYLNNILKTERQLAKDVNNEIDGYML